MALQKIKLRYDTLLNYATYAVAKVPEKGEVCLINEFGTIRAKVGDGSKTIMSLPYSDSKVFQGYYYDGEFYLDVAHSEECKLPKEAGLIYIDKDTEIIYYFNPTKEAYIANKAEVATATSERAGIMKLYQALGQNTDGTVSQKVITDAIDSINLAATETEELYLSKIVIPSEDE